MHAERCEPLREPAGDRAAWMRPPGAEPVYR